MPLQGLEKQKYNFVHERLEQQDVFWPEFCRKWDEENKGKRFKSEVRSLSDLWTLYRRGVVDNPLADEEEARGKKKAPKLEKGYEVVPAKAFEIPGRFHEKAYDSNHKSIHAGEHGYLHFPHWLLARDQARKDLYWLGKTVLGKDFESHVHQVICDQFVQKDFDGVFAEGFTLRQLQATLRKQHRIPRIAFVQEHEYSGVEDSAKLLDDGVVRYAPDPTQAEIATNLARTMILLDPRGFFKSTIDVIDTVQWLINAPDLRILIVSGVIKLASQFLAGVKGYLYLPKSLQPGPFHYLFPEYVLRGVDGTSDEDLVLPLGVRQHGSLDPNVGVTSVGSNKAGFHCDILKFDDIVTETNCLTEDTREAILQKADSTRNLLMSWGWHDIIGTRYFTDDYYGRTKDKHDEAPDEFNLKYFVRACWTVKPEFKHIEAKSLYELTEDMVTLTFPEQEGGVKESFKHLRSILRKNEKEFRCQQLNQPVWGNENPTFPHELLMNHIKSFQEATGVRPTQEIIGAIDLAKEDKRFSDYTCLAVGKIYEEIIPNQNSPVSPWVIQQDGRRWHLVILDVEFGRWSQSETAYRIAKLNDKWRPKRWKAEDNGGLESFKEKIINTAKENFGHWPIIRWEVPSNQYNAKVNRIKGMEILLRDNRMWFMNSSWNQEVFIQLERYTGQKSTRSVKDDVPDCLSMLANALPNIFPLTPKEKEALAAQKEQEYKAFLQRAIKREIFGDDSGGFGMQPQYFPTPGRELPDDTSNDPLSDTRRNILGAGPWR